MSQTEIAKAVATIAHLGQTDKSGHQYIDHPRRVAHRLLMDQADQYIVAAGWLHDVLEDTSLTRDDLHAAGIDWQAISVVEAVTRAPKQSVEDYYEQIAKNYGARLVKHADIADNLMPERLALLDDATIVRLTRKYAKALDLLGVTS